MAIVPSEVAVRGFAVRGSRSGQLEAAVVGGGAEPISARWHGWPWPNPRTANPRPPVPSYNPPMPLSAKRVAVLVEDGFEDAELSGPVSGLTEAGVRVTLVGPQAARQYTGKRGLVITSDAAAGACACGTRWWT